MNTNFVFNEGNLDFFRKQYDTAFKKEGWNGVRKHSWHIIFRGKRLDDKLYEDGDVDQKIECAKIIMNENIYKDIDPEELALKLNISYSWFRKVFKDYTGYAPAKYFQELKLRKAKQLLVETSQSVKEISFLLNYASTEHFFSLFKKRTGFTPIEYRNFGRERNFDKEE